MGDCETIAKCGSRCALLIYLFVAGPALLSFPTAHAQAVASGCAHPVARVVALQGDVRLRQAQGKEWLPVTRLDTSLCTGDHLRTDALSRAALFVHPETVIRVDQNTVITLNQSVDEITVEFCQDALANPASGTASCGAGYFITRFPKKFQVKTPHMNAAVEGTEFMVAASRDASQLTVLEGTVASEAVATGERRLVEAGQSIANGTGGAGTISAVVKPEDAVQWVLRYPPLSEGSDASRAEDLLRAGSVDNALAEIDSILRDNRDDSDALSLRSIIKTAKNDKASALESANQATVAGPDNYRAWLALSYAQQAGFDLEAALESSQRAASIEADNSLAQARVAELLLSLGDVRRAEQAARGAVASNPSSGNAQGILGFVYLAKIDTQAAQVAFRAAIERDSFSSLPRLGLGLALIRDGALVAGREQIEIAVALDPANSLLRSHAGKAYYEENSNRRDELALIQFELARQLDPRDPTPWLYESIMLQTSNRPIEAVESLQRSIALNDNRAVYRSRGLLVEDSAVRGASLARAYREIGFDLQALKESSASLSADPANSSAHRFLADSYLALPRHEVARRSEFLQSQLLQPLNATPVQPQLTEDNFFVLQSAGPTSTGFNEYTPLYTQNGVAFQVDLLGGELGTWGDQVIVSGLQDRLSFAVSQLAYETDGVRVNDAFDKELYTGFLQFDVAAETSVQAEVRHSESDFGDPLLAFDPELVIDEQHELRESRARLGARHSYRPDSDLIVSASFIDQGERIFSFGELAVDQDIESIVIEAQHVWTTPNFNLVSGLAYDREQQDSVFFGQPARARPYAASGYAYYNFNFPRFPLTAHLGLSLDYLADSDDLTPSKTELNPKVGVTITPWHGATLRAATFNRLGRQFAISETLEPTQIAGFNQLFDDLPGSESRRTAIAIDQNLRDDLFLGAQWSRRDLTVQFDFEGEEYEWDERALDVHAYWAPTSTVALSIAYQEERFERPVEFPGKELIVDITSKSLPAAISVHLRTGIFAKAVATYVEQSGEFFFIAAGPDPVPAEDSFWVVDASLGYRLPKRKGTITLELRNLLDEEFQYQETDLFRRKYATERIALVRASLAF